MTRAEGWVRQMGSTASYVGPPDVHGATVVAVERGGSVVTVRLASDEGRAIVLRFAGVTDLVCARDVAGHRIHALWEVDAAEARRFVFVPDDAAAVPKLELTAAGFGEVD